MRMRILLTVDQRAKIAHFQEQNKFVAPQMNDWILVEKNTLMKGRRGHTIYATDV